MNKATINTGLKLVVWGIPLGLALRLVQLSFFFDFDTGFYTDGGLTAWLSLLLPAAMGAAGAALFCRNGRAFTGRREGQAMGPGAFAGFSGGAVLVMGAAMLRDLMDYRRLGLSQFETTANQGLHGVLAVLSIAFGLLQCWMAVCLCTGRDPFKRAPLLYLPGVLWGMALLVSVYVFYARSSSLQENLMSMLSTAMLLAALLYVCRALAGAAPQDMERMFIFGGMAAVLAVPYDLGNIVFAMRGMTYFGELPPLYALCRLLVSLFVLSFMLSCYRTSVDKSVDGTPPEAKHLEG